MVLAVLIELGPEHPDTAASLKNLGMLYIDQGAYAEAEQLFSRALAICENALGLGHPDTAQSLINLALAYTHQGTYAEAEPLCSRALEINERALGPDHPDTAQSLLNLALVYTHQGAYAEAETLCSRALEVNERALGPDHPDTAQSLIYLALVYTHQGVYAKAEPLFVRALAINEKVLGPNHLQTAKSLNHLAWIYNSQGAYAQAEPLCLRALEINENLLKTDHSASVESLNNLARVYENQGAYAKAEPLFLRALAINEKVLGPNHPTTANSLSHLALLYNEQGAYAKAETLFVRALEISEKALGSDHPSTAASLNNLALLYTSQGADAKAEPLYIRAMAINRRALGSDHPSTALSLNNLAGLYCSQGDYAKAEPLYVRALEINERALGTNHPNTALSLNNLAGLYDSQGDYAKAEPLYVRALEIRKKELGADHPTTASSLNNLAELYRSQGAYTKAKPLYFRALAIKEKALEIDHPDTITCLNNLSFFLLTQGDLVESHHLLSLALNRQLRWLIRELPLLCTSKRFSFLRKHMGGGNIAASFAFLRDEFVPIALWCRFNLHGLLQEIERRQLLLSGLGGSWVVLVETLRGLVNHLASTTLAPAQRQQLLLQRDELEAKLFSAFPQLAIPLVEVAEVAACLQAGSLLIEFQRFTPYGPYDALIDSSPRYLALLLPGDKPPVAVDLGPALLLEQAIEDALLASAEELDDADTLWDAVSERLLSPLRDHLSDCRQCFLCPDGELHRVAFTALTLPGAPGTRFAEECQLHLLASSRQLIPHEPTPSQGTRSLVVADPAFHHPSSTGPASTDIPPSQRRSRDMGGLAAWGPLPATAVEGRQVAELLGGALLLGEAASAGNLQQVRHPRVLHVASHGYFLPDQDTTTFSPDLPFRSELPMGLLASFSGEDPMLRSGLVLAGANDPCRDPEDDGYLTALEATHLDLHGTELVTLSACDTGRGDIRTGEGVYGLQRALIVAGARSTLLSLWKVPDEPTCAFMLRFYTLLKKGAGRADALLRVQQEFRRHENLAWRHPHYWAAWQLVGDWRSIQGL